MATKARIERRRHPAGRGLYRKVRHLGQHRRPRPDGQPRRLRAGRCARGLGDHPRALRRARQEACPLIRLANCARKLYAAFPHFAAIDEIATGDSGEIAAVAKKAGEDGQIRVCVSGQRLLFDEPDSARFGRHGGVLGIGPQQLQSCGGIGEGKGLWTHSFRPMSGQRLIMIGQSLLLLVAPADLHRLHSAGRPQDLGSRAAAPRTECGRSVRTFPVLRRSFEVRLQGAGHSGGRQQERVPAGAAGGRDAGARRPGRSSRSAKAG